MADVVARVRSTFAQLTVFGGVSYDTIVTVPRFLRADDKLWGSVVGRFPGGMAGNVAAAFATLGGKAAIVSAIGRDLAGYESLAILKRLNVDTSRVIQDAGSTFQTLAMIDGSGEKAMLLLKASDLVSGIDPEVKNLRPGVDAIHIIPGRFAPRIEAIAEWYERGVHVSFDIEPTMIDQGLDYRMWLRAADVLFCADAASQKMSCSSSPELRVRDLLSWGPKVAVITLGKQGAIMGTHGGELLHHIGAPVSPVDTTGAGDAFAGAFLFGLSRDWSLRQCLAMANLVGGRCTEHYGAQGFAISPSDIRALPEFLNTASEDFCT